MKTSTLILRSLMHYWRIHVAVFFGVVAGTAVISGALIVGDSVRESLKAMSLARLGGVDLALHSPRFIREETADVLAESPDLQAILKSVAPALIMDGAIVRESNDGSVNDRAGGIRVYGVDDRFGGMSEFDEDSIPNGDQLVLSDRVARQLNAKVGDELTLWVEMPATIPRESQLGGIEDQDTQSIPLVVSAIFPETSGTGRFDLSPGQQLPLTVFVSLENLQEAVGLETVRRSRDFPQGKPARINAVFATLNSNEVARSSAAIETAAQTTTHLGESLTLEDLSLRVVENDRGYLALESEQMILEDSFANAAQKAAEQSNQAIARNMVYLVNELSNVKNADAFSAYSIIAGVDLSEVAAAPFGPLVTGDPVESLNDDEIILNDWLAEDLDAQPGDSIQIKYHQVGSHGELPEQVLTLKVRAIVPLASSVTASDRGLTPEVKGITDANTFSAWKQPFPMDLDRPTDRDDEYWEKYKALPKAFVSLDLAKSLWTSRYGSLTSIRIAASGTAGKIEPLEEAQSPFTNAFLQQLNPQETGLVFLPVKYNGIKAASGTTDFTTLFVGFSFFVIASAMILISLLFRLGVERRTASIGVLQAIGFNRRMVRRLILKEGLVVACLGGAIGSLVAVGYAELMIFALKDPDWWGGAIGTQFLDVYPKPVSLFAGFAISIIVALLALYFALRGLNDISTRQLLAGDTDAALTDAAQEARAARQFKWARNGAIFSLIVLAAGLFGLVPSSEAFSGFSWPMVAFFVVGIVSLTSAMFQLSAWLAGDRRSAVRGSGILGASRLGFRNAARHRSRSVLSTGLIASATFVIVAVAAGQRNPAVETPDFNSGNGGFSLVAEASAPLLDSLQTPEGRIKLGISPEADSEDAHLLEQMQTYSFRVRPGENASCLNLYQTTLPTILGVPDDLLARGGFRFVDQRKADYWKLLATDRDDGRIPVLGDMNTLMFSLHKAPGASIAVPDSETELVVSGMLDGSVLQGVLLMSDSNFRKMFPKQTGFRYFLIGANEARIKSLGHFSKEEANRLTSVLEGALTPYGFDAERVSDRIAAFLIVQNTYLSTFQSLGGLGLLLGTLGLATVMLRNVVERRSELALLRAVGFRRRSLSVMVLAENAMLLIWGLASGTICALLAMLPHLLSTGADTPWLNGAALLLTVFVVGMLSALFAVREASRTPIVSTLRGE
ncbi:MAG: FtsX-like permease family protein [Rhodopirellula sp.]|nr:FtsX-like permease family protein [Rhodopirellula sp.]